MLKRTDKYGENRFYYDTDTGKFYISATSFCKMVLPENKYLTKWKQELGEFEANRRAKMAAHYGTLMHELIEQFLEHKTLERLDIELATGNYINAYSVDADENRWIKDLTNDLLAFAQFAYDRELEVYATEQWMKRDITPTSGIAGTLDFQGSIKWRKGRQDVIIDFKSGRNGFYAASELQLHLYKQILGKDVMLFNWSPKRWETEPTYNFKNQTDSKMGQKLEHYIEIAKIEGMFESKARDLHFEELTLGKQPVFEVKMLKDLMEMENI